MNATLLTIEVRFEQDVVMTRQRARQIAQALGFDSQAQTRIATAVSEMARNAFQYAKGGKVEFRVEGLDSQIFLICIRDQGSGIPHLKAILNGQYTSETGMGLGIIGTKRLMDQFHIESSPLDGTTVLMGKILPKRSPILTALRLAQISNELVVRSPQDPFQEIQQQNQELFRTLEELQKRQTELTQLNRELEDTNRGVVALYAELDEKAASLQRANELKTRFLSNISHEFRTPLNSIMSLSRFLLERMDGELTPEQEKQVMFIRKSAEGLSELVNDLLDLAKVEAGKIVVHPDEFEVSDLFGALRGMLRPLLTHNSSISLLFEEPVGIPMLSTDEGKVAQILRNFISNALKYTEHGEVRVAAALGSSNTVVFSVADTGIGIAPEDQKRIFDEFTQLDNPMQKRAKGTGLGLPLSRKLAELLGGSVSVESELGVGSTFFAVIPLVYLGFTENAQELKVSRQLDKLNLLVKPGPQQKLLIIDDDQVSRYLLKELLADTHFTIIEAVAGHEGIRLAHEENPACIFLDLMMPEMNGFEVLEQLKSDPATSNIPVIVHTSNLLQPQERRHLTERTVAIISKEISQREVAIALIREALMKAGLVALEDDHV